MFFEEYFFRVWIFPYLFFLHFILYINQFILFIIESYSTFIPIYPSPPCLTMWRISIIPSLLSILILN